jgi:hypothetical protein
MLFGYIGMKIEELVNVLESYGYLCEIEENSSLYWSVREKFGQTVITKPHIDRVFKFTKFPKERYNDKNFFIFEQDYVTSNGIEYSEEGKLFYFYAFGSDPSKIYRDGELNQILDDIYNEMKELLSKSELRHIKLTRIEI